MKFFRIRRINDEIIKKSLQILGMYLLVFIPGFVSIVYRNLIASPRMKDGDFALFIEGGCWFLAIVGSILVSIVVVFMASNKKIDI